MNASVSLSPGTATPLSPGGADTDLPDDAAGFGGDDQKPPECPPCKGGAPSWMATFADMATLLMSFFVLILSFSDTELPRFEQINGSIKHAFGVKRIMPTITIPGGRTLVVEEFSPSVSQRSVAADPRQISHTPQQNNVVANTTDQRAEYQQEDDLVAVQTALAESIERGDVEVYVKDEKIIVELDADTTGSGDGGGGRFPREMKPLDQRVLDVAATLDELDPRLRTEVELFRLTGYLPDAAELGNDTGSGDRTAGDNGDSGRYAQIQKDLKTQIEQGQLEVEKIDDKVVIRLASQGSFVSGQAELEPGFETLLMAVGRTASEGEGSIRVEGHTDNVPVAFNDLFESNWDLSAARSASVAAFFVSRLGIDASRLEVAGYADTRPLQSNATASGRARNRRIEIIVED